MKIQLNKSGNITYFATLTQVENGYQVAYEATGSEQTYLNTKYGNHYKYTI